MVRVDLQTKDKYKFPLGGCRVWFVLEAAVPCPADGDSQRSVEIEVPDSPELELHWEAQEPGVNQVANSAPYTESGIVDFTILQVDVSVKPNVAVPGKPLNVIFSAVTEGLRITKCGVAFAGVDGRCDEIPARQKVIEIVIPDSVPPGGQDVLKWSLTYLYARAKPSRDDVGTGTTKVGIALLPPKFDVSPSTAQPGLPLVVTFRSNTTGVTIDDCGITYQAQAGCSPARTAVVMIPPDTPVGSRLRIPWFLHYKSARPGEKPDAVQDVLSVPVVAERVRFTVTAQPGSGRPGDEITLTIEPTVKGVSIVDCLVFFPSADGGTCQATDERWFARTWVPAGTAPGATLLHWGVGSVDAAGAPLADHGDLPFDVLPPKGKTTPTPSRSRTRLTLPPVESTTPRTTTTTTTTTTTNQEPHPEYVARTEPEAAKPGKSVRVTVSALTPATAITGCRATFGGERIVPCAGSGGLWIATLTVPRDAEPGDLPLLWDVTSPAGPGNGTIAYRVLGNSAPSPQFGVEVDPASVPPGGHIKVTHRSYDNGPPITGCNAGIAPGGVLAACAATARGWVADVVVPKDAPPGTATLLWQVAYNAGAATADGRTNVGVLAQTEDHQPWWKKVLGVILKSGAVALLGVALFGGRTLLRRLRGRLQRTKTEDAELPELVDVVAVRPAGPLSVMFDEPDAPPRRLIRLTVRRPPPGIHIGEEPP